MPNLRLGIDARGGRSGARDFTRSTNQVTKSAQLAGNAVRSFVGAIAAGFVIRQAAGLIADYEESIVTLGGVAGASASQLQRLDDVARDLGATTRFSAIQTADGLTFLARAGFEVEEAIAALPSTLDLAQVGMLDLGKAADIASNVVSQFALEATQTEQVVDALVIVSNRANTNISQLSEALKFAGPVAGAFNNTVEQTAAALGVLGDRGIQGTLAGTGLRTALLKLADPTSRAREAIEGLNLSIRSLSPETNDIVTIFGRLGEAQASATELGRIFGARTAATSIILSRSTDRVLELERATADYAGEASKIARLQDDTLSGSFKSLTSAASELVLSLGDSGLGGGLRSVTDIATDTIRALAGVEVEGRELSGGVKALAFTIKTVTVASTALISVRLGSFFASFAADTLRAITLQRQFAVAIDQTSRVAGLQRALAGLSSPLGLVITGASLAAASFIDLGTEAERLEERLDRAGAGVSDLSDQIERLEENRARIEQAAELGNLDEVARLAANDFDILNESAVQLRQELNELGAGATTSLGDALKLGLEQTDLDSLVRSARLELRNAFAEAAEDGFIKPDEIASLRTEFGTLFDDEAGVFGDSVDAFFNRLERAPRGFGGEILEPDLFDADTLLLGFESSFEQARLRNADILELINNRIRSVAEVAGEVGEEAGAALDEGLTSKLEMLRLAVEGVDLEGQLSDPATVLREAIDGFGEALDESGVKLDATSSAVTTLERALEQLEKAEDKLAERQADGLKSLEALRQGLVDERSEVGLSANELSQLRLERELNGIAQKGEIEISSGAREELIALREEIDRGRVVQEQSDQAARSTVQALNDYASGAATAEEAASRLFASLQQQLLDQFTLQPLTELISGGIQSSVSGLQGLFGGAGVEDATGAATEGLSDTAQSTALTTAITAASTSELTGLVTQTTALSAALTVQTTAITGALAAGGASGGIGAALGGAGGAAALIAPAGGAAGAGAGAGAAGVSSAASGFAPNFGGGGSGFGAGAAGASLGGGQGPQSGASQVNNITNNMITTPNVDSFKRSGRQAANMARRTARV